MYFIMSKTCLYQCFFFLSILLFVHHRLESDVNTWPTLLFLMSNCVFVVFYVYLFSCQNMPFIAVGHVQNMSTSSAFVYISIYRVYAAFWCEDMVNITVSHVKMCVRCLLSVNIGSWGKMLFFILCIVTYDIAYLVRHDGAAV